MYKGHRLKGVVIEIGEIRSGFTSKSNWRFQDIVLEHDPKFPKKACITFGTEILERLQDYRIGDSVQVNFRIESNKFKERWYTNLKAISIKLIDMADNETPEVWIKPE